MFSGGIEREQWDEMMHDKDISRYGPSMSKVEIFFGMNYLSGTCVFWKIYLRLIRYLQERFRKFKDHPLMSVCGTLGYV